MPSEFETKIDDIASSYAVTVEQEQLIAAVYAEIMLDMNQAVTKARLAVTKIPQNAEGINELKQLLRIMDGQFVKIATNMIARVSAPAIEEEPPV